MKHAPFLITDISSIRLNEDEKKWLTHPIIFGVLLFSANYENPKQICQLVESIKNINPSIKIFVDQEGGRVQRFKNGFNIVEPMQTFGTQFNLEPTIAKLNLKNSADTLARELKNIGIDINFAPVIDCDYGNIKGAIGDRAFSSNPKIVFELSKVVIKSFINNGIEPTLKHFPGHGFVDLDTHFSFTTDNRNFDELNQELQIYPWLVSHFKNKIQYLMLSHLVYSCFDDLPVFLSRKWIKYIREVIEYKGYIISDDLNMKAATHFGNIIELAQKSLKVGCDLIILTHNEKAKKELLSQFF